MAPHEPRAIVETHAFPLSRGKMQAIYCWKANMRRLREIQEYRAMNAVLFTKNGA